MPLDKTGDIEDSTDHKGVREYPGMNYPAAELLLNVTG